jgi:hypothetical protein
MAPIVTGTALQVDHSWSIELAGDDPVARFAARELRRTLQRIGAPPLPIVAHAEGPRIALAYGAGGDGFARAADAAGLTISGAGPRGLLYGVYDLLEALGCRWVAPGHDGERLPRLEMVALPADASADWPALQGRCLIIGHDFFLRDAEDWIAWSARNRLNTIFIHTIDAPLALGACHIDSWRARRPALLPLLQERGMTIELGGHGMSALVPRSLFRTLPQAFRHNGSARTPDRNFCPTSPEALALLRRNGAAFFRAHPEAELLHLWPDDILGGGWCRCERCAHLSPSDQALLATNVLAEALAELRPEARIAYLAYHDTQGAPTHVRPQRNVVLCYAPRSRSYGHALDDPASGVNAAYARDLRENIAWFEAAGCGEHRIFEYYLDGLLFKSALPPLTPVLPGDIAAYRAAGAHAVQALMTGDRPWVAPPVNAYLFARLAWRPDQPVDALMATYAAARAPHAAQQLVRAHDALARAWQPALAIAPGEVVQRMDINPIAAPPADVLDYMAAPRALRERRLEQIERALPLLDEVRAAWRDVLAVPPALAEALRGEHAEAELCALQLQFVASRQRLYVLEGRGAAAALLVEAAKPAQQALDALLAWSHKYLGSPRARAGFALLRQLGQLHIDAVLAPITGAAGRSLRQARTLGRIARLLARLRLAQE